MSRKAIIGIAAAALVLALVVVALLPKGAYVGSRYSNKYHDPDCAWAESMSPENRVWFDDAVEAADAGYVPCEECDPQ